VNNEFPEEYIPTVFDNYDTTVKFKTKDVTLSVWDTVGFSDCFYVIDTIVWIQNVDYNL